MASVGKYNETYFKNHPEEAQKEGVLYGVILVNKKTHEREIIKVGIAAGKDWCHVIKRARGFQGYDLRIQRTWTSTQEEVFNMEQMLHAKFLNDKLEPSHKFGGHTECFKPTSKILEEFPKKWT